MEKNPKPLNQYYVLLLIVSLERHFLHILTAFTSTKSCENLTWLKHQNQSVTPDWLLNKISILSPACVGEEMRLGVRGSSWYRFWPQMHTFWSEILVSFLHTKARLVLFQWNCMTLHRGVCVLGWDIMLVNVTLNWNNWEIFSYKPVKCYFKKLA